MADHDDPSTGHVSRRALLSGAAALGAGAGAGLLGSSSADAAPIIAAARPEVLGPVGSSLTYLPIDALAFDVYSAAGNEHRYYQDATGIAPLTPMRRVAASLPIPIGSVIRQLNVAFQGQPIAEIHRRQLANPDPPTMVSGQITLEAGGGSKTQTLTFNPAITVEQACTYSLQFWCSAGASIFGATIGYLPPTLGFQPFVGVDPRVLDTRTIGGKLQPNEERTVALGFPGARGAVLNLTVTDTEGGGFVAVFPAGISWPGNSTINWSSSDQNIANGVTAALDVNGQVTIRGGANRTHVVIDRVGWLL